MVPGFKCSTKFFVLRMCGLQKRINLFPEICSNLWGVAATIAGVHSNSTVTPSYLNILLLNSRDYLRYLKRYTIICIFTPFKHTHARLRQQQAAQLRKTKHLVLNLSTQEQATRKTKNHYNRISGFEENQL